MNPTQSPTNPHAAGKAAQVPKLNFHVSGHIKQLCDMANNYSVELGLGPKVRAQDFIDASAVAIARDHAGPLAALEADRERLRGAIVEALTEIDNVWGNAMCAPAARKATLESAFGLLRAAIARATGQGEGV